MKKVALTGQISGVRVLMKLLAVSPGKGGLRDNEREMIVPQVEAAIATLEWLEAHRADVLALIAKDDK